ncbi:cytochrome P450 [Kitasatospora sp. NBC_01246]|uniref:cytochrome P450 n=1 Tax=Kitasatospora sp. NBC_01246 TaxID=2903570 RepID=UPI002E341086|nr:cytochrome P450 [Kitasatospora sp. NBC_01246]
MTHPESAPEVLRYPFGEPHLLDLDHRYAGLRDTEGLGRVEVRDLGSAWLCSRYADVRRILTDSRFGLTPPADPATPPDGAGPAADAAARCPVAATGANTAAAPGREPAPTSAQVTRVTRGGLKPRQVERLRGATEKIADELLDGLGRLDRGGPPGARATTDLMAGFVKPLAAEVLCELLDIPAGERPGVRARLLGAATTASPPSGADQEDRRALARRLAELIAARDPAGRSADDLLSAMIRARGEGEERLSDRQLVIAALRLLLPGLQNTVLMLSNFVRALMHHRSELERLRHRPDLVPSAVEELIRFTPFHSTSTFPRYASEDVEVGGTLIRRGEVAVGALCAANRDERAFTDPDSFDIGRGENAHLGFGMGTHHCPGAALARMQLQVAIAALARRVDDLYVAPVANARSVHDPGGRVIGWFDPLPATWSAIRP